MSPQSHPDHETLLAYLHEPGREQYADIALHLAQCQSCREQLQTTTWLKSAYPQLEITPIDEHQQQQVDDFVYGRHAPAAQERLRQAIKDDAVALKSALHSLTGQQGAEQRGIAPVLANTRSTQTAGAAQPGHWLNSLWQWFNTPSTTWITASVTAGITMAVVLVVLQAELAPNSERAGLNLAAYQDDATIYFTATDRAMPGIGFFNTAGLKQQPYAHPEISLLNQNELRLQWPSVARAQLYRLQVYRFDQGERQLLHELQTESNNASIKLAEAPVTGRYEWVLSGATGDQQSFSTRGGFVIDGRQAE